MTRTILALTALALTSSAEAKIQTKPMEYQQGGTKLQGFYAYDDAVKGKRPGIIVVHEWWGHNEHARNQAIRLAKAGYAAFALDMYGKGKVAKHPEDAKKFMTEATKDDAVVKARFDVAVALLKKQPQVDPQRLGAVGYCMGGNIALSMARAGEDLKAVSTFHAAIPSADGPAPGKVTSRILINTGADDPMVQPAQIEPFVKQMKDAGANVEVISYPGAKHGFTNPDAAKAGMDALAYDKSADEKSWEATTKMFGEVFGKKG